MGAASHSSKDNASQGNDECLCDGVLFAANDGEARPLSGTVRIFIFTCRTDGIRLRIFKASMYVHTTSYLTLRSLHPAGTDVKKSGLPKTPSTHHTCIPSPLSVSPPLSSSLTKAAAVTG